MRIFTDDLDTVITGQVLPLKASGHRYNDDVDLQGVGWELVEVRVDEPVEDVAGLRALGIDVGDFVALVSEPQLLPSGFVKARHLDDKAGVAAVLGAFKAVVDAGIRVPVTAHLLVTCTEEIGHGASHGVDPEVAEIVSVDAAVVAPGQQSRENAATVAMGDGVGPFDYHLTRKLTALATEHGVDAVRDVFDHYRSDVAAAARGRRARARGTAGVRRGRHPRPRAHPPRRPGAPRAARDALPPERPGVPGVGRRAGGRAGRLPVARGAAGARGGPAGGTHRRYLASTWHQP